MQDHLLHHVIIVIHVTLIIHVTFILLLRALTRNMHSRQKLCRFLTQLLQSTLQTLTKTAA